MVNGLGTTWAIEDKAVVIRAKAFSDKNDRLFVKVFKYVMCLVYSDEC